MDGIIKPRSLKSKYVQNKRKKSKGEVFTPSWMIKKQNDVVEDNIKNEDIVSYVNTKWIEITCGEAPYIVTRYDMETGKHICIHDRVGFLDRKIQRINAEINNKNEWIDLVEDAYKASYGFEWSGDSLLIARENLLYTYKDYYNEKWNIDPTYDDFKMIAEIISYNLFQMDGLTYTIPLSNKKAEYSQLDIFGNVIDDVYTGTSNIRVKIMNWEKNKMEYFGQGIIKS